MGAPEWPSLRAFIPDVRGTKSPDLGCSFGWYFRWAQKNGTREIKALELSENMVGKARTLSQDPPSTYERADLEALDLQANKYEFVFVKNLPGIAAQARRVLLLLGRTFYLDGSSKLSVDS